MAHGTLRATRASSQALKGGAIGAAMFFMGWNWVRYDHSPADEAISMTIGTS